MTGQGSPYEAGAGRVPTGLPAVGHKAGEGRLCAGRLLAWEVGQASPGLRLQEVFPAVGRRELEPVAR